MLLGAAASSLRRTALRVLRSRAARVLLAIIAALATWALVRRYALRPAAPPPDEATLEHVRRVRVVRDTWGVPHVFGERDQDAAFGLAYAHAEDDWPTIQAVLAASRGRLGLLKLSTLALANDWYTELVGVRAEVDATYAALPADVRAVLEAYARGLGYYAYQHPREVDTRLLPFSGRDIAAGFAHKLPIMVGLDKVLQVLRSDAPPRVGAPVFPAPPAPTSGSNAHALAAARATDGITRLNVNSHQPWEGPVAWYEAHVHSDEGWDMTGGTFPGAPFILHGHNADLGWALTVNAPDLVDVYELVRDDAHPGQYRFDGAWRDLEVHEGRLVIDTGLFDLSIPRTFQASVHGPVVSGERGAFAVRYAGIGRRLRAVEQWFRMNKATSFDAWRAAMRVGGVPMFNAVYADPAHVFYVYNGLLGRRADGFDYTTVLPGDRSDVIFQDYLAFDELPQVLDPPSGFVQSCNATPFAATAGEGNPKPGDFAPTFGVETQQSNRAIRSLALLGTGAKLSRDDFLRMKWDRAYDPSSKMFSRAVRPLLDGFSPRTDGERRAIELLRGWDGTVDESSRAAALAIMTYKILDPAVRGDSDPKLTDPGAALRDVIGYLEKGFGRVDVPLGEVQRLRRGAVDLPLGGAPDTLNATYAKRRDGHIVGTQGDSLVMLVEFAPGGVRSSSIQPFGASNRPGSPHHADQAPLFVARQLKPTWRALDELGKHTERAYRPGEEAR
jgi:acyl-homoserine lactone acylase PvdQ